jgi:hypothetical protein
MPYFCFATQSSSLRGLALVQQAARQAPTPAATETFLETARRGNKLILRLDRASSRMSFFTTSGAAHVESGAQGFVNCALRFWVPTERPLSPVRGGLPVRNLD